MNRMNMNEYEDSISAACLIPAMPYPANHFAFRHVVKEFSAHEATSIVEIGVGMGGAIPLFAGAGFNFSGIDRDLDCVQSSRLQLHEAGQNAERIVQADLEDLASLSNLPDSGSFDGLIAMGVFPHLTSVRQGIINAVGLVRPGGHVFLEFRNALFSLVTFNRYTREFICDRLLVDASPEVRAAVDAELQKRLNLQVPSGVIHPETFHVPFEIIDLAHDLGLTKPQVIPFHFHAGMPAIEEEVPQSFRLDSVALEEDSSGWKGLFLASAFLLHVQRPA